MRTIRLDLRSAEDAGILAAVEVSGYSRWWVEPAMSLDPLPDQWTGLPELEVRQVATEADVRIYGELEAEERAAAESDPLSEREREVLRLLALGHTNHEIAQRLYISVRTAESHRAHIMQKLRLSTRAELVRYALLHGLLSEEPS